MQRIMTKLRATRTRNKPLRVDTMKKLWKFCLFLLHGLFLAILLHGLFLGIAPSARTQTVPTAGLASKPSAWATLAQKLESRSSKAKEKSNVLSDLPAVESVVTDAEKLEGLFTLYNNQDTGEVFAEISQEQLEKNFLCTVTLESGIGERGIYSGMPVGDYLFYFRRVNKNLHFVIRNVNFRTDPDDPQRRSLERSFSDSVLYSLEIKGFDAERNTLLVDMGELLLGDFPGLSSIFHWVLGTPYELDAKKSYFGSANSFPMNVEIESIYSFSAAGGDENTYIPSLPDSRAFTLRLHYSLSQLDDTNGYRPRLADDRVGYFMTVYKDFSNDHNKDPFVRYINRWHLEKQNPSALVSPPKEPIVFWIDNAVPVEYRESIREGVLLWNKAFEKAGYQNAIDVRQMPDEAEWDPADVRYNTIRWINSLDGAFAMGPSRVNPLTGQILDADIIVDANFVRAIKREYGTLVEQERSSSSSLFAGIGGNSDLCTFNSISRYLPNKEGKTGTPDQAQEMAVLGRLMQSHDLCYGMQSADQFSVGAMSLSLINNLSPESSQMKEYVHQFVRSLIAHEVGHTLGLRHNFHASTMLMPQDLNNTNITQSKGLASSVMDYLPVNLAPIGVEQGDYYPAVVGPYDEWAIQYGYQTGPGTAPQDEVRFLEKIAQRAPNSDLAYATDEDIWFDDINPFAHPFDLSGDVLLYSQQQMDNARYMWERLEKRYLPKGESYNELRVLFNTVFGYYFQQAYFVSQYVGGQSFTRNHAGDPNGRAPFMSVPAAKQRQALATLQTYIFNDNAFNFSPELLNNLAPSRWVHWGNYAPIFRLDYPIYEQISFLQRVVLRVLMHPQRLARLRDAEIKAQPGVSLTLPELFDTLQQGVWTEVMVEGMPVEISSLRRSLQREYLDILTQMVLRQSEVPQDARTLAWYKLRQLGESLDTTLAKGAKFDTYTQAHLEETRDRINKTLDAQLQSS